VLSVGGTVGDGVADISSLALGRLIGLVSIMVGATWGLKALEEDYVLGGLKAMISRN